MNKENKDLIRWMRTYFSDSYAGPSMATDVLLKKGAAELEALMQHITISRDRIKQLRRDIDNIKIRAYEVGNLELHDMALKALIKDSEDRE